MFKDYNVYCKTQDKAHLQSVCKGIRELPVFPIYLIRNHIFNKKNILKSIYKKCMSDFDQYFFFIKNNFIDLKFRYA